MLEALVGQFLGSTEGASALSQLGAQGLTVPQVQAAVQATADGAAEHAKTAGLDLGGLVGAGGAGGALGALVGAISGREGLGGLLGGAKPGAPTASAGPFAALVGPVTQFVAQKTGLAPQVAQTVVNVVLPRLLGLMQKH